MPQYSNTITSPSGLVTTAVLNTGDNTITYTLTAPNGATATRTQSSSLGGYTTSNINGIFAQLAAGGYTVNPANRIEIVSGARTTTVAVKQQATKAQTAATATDTPVPAAPAPPAPTNNTADPAVPPVPVALAVENAVSAPAPITTTEATAPALIVASPQKQAEETDDQARLRITRENEAREDTRIEAAENNNTNRGTSVAERNTQTQATQQDISNFNSKEDWRVRLSLASGADYLYKSSEPGILGPLLATNGVIFPYTPAISVAYAAQYDPTTLTHTNYKYYTYNSSSVDQITLSCDFTAQDVFEANYLLAVIHFFRSVTKMFYGQDQDPKPGTPPPLCYLTGLGAFQFDNHPIAITNFTYSLPTEVDYIRAGSTQEQPKSGATSSRSNSRIQNAGLQSGATVAPPQFSGAYRVQEPTYVPTKIQISITAVPVVTRNDISNNFSLKDYGTGMLLRRTSGGGIW